jgi:ParB family chromosome partitioning protein
MTDEIRPVKSMGLVQPPPREPSITPLPPIDGLRGIERLKEAQKDNVIIQQQESIVQLLPIDRLVEYEYNPRWVYKDDTILEMSESLSANGIINPIHVTPDLERDGWYKVLAGRTRVRAIQQYLKHREEFQNIPAIIHRALSKKELAILAYTENQSRSTQFPVDVGLYCYKLLEDGIFKSQKELAGAMRDTEVNISRLLSFGKLKSSILEIVRNYPEKFSHLTASLLLQTQNQYSEEAALKLAQGVVDYGWSQRQLARAVDKLKNQDESVTENYETINLLSSRYMMASVKTESSGRMELRLSGLADPKQREDALKIVNILRQSRRL